MKYLLGIDIGTTSLKAAVFDENANMMKAVTKDYTLDVKGDFLEFPAEKYFDMMLDAMSELRRKYDIFAMSTDTQCETLIVTDGDGKPLMPTIVWLDNRAVKTKRTFTPSGADYSECYKRYCEIDDKLF